MAPKKKKKKKPEEIEASPAKSLGEELSALQKSLRRVAQAYEQKLTSDLAQVVAWNDQMLQSKKLSREQVRDLGDMLGLLRRLKLKPEKGRRRDLRKIDSVLNDLVALSRQKRAA